MLRRFTLLAVLLLTLSVIAPAVLACEPDDGCCPEQGAQCEPAGAEVIAEAKACCAEQPTPAVVSASVRELEALDLQLSKGAPPAATTRTRRLHSAHADFICPIPRPPDQRQLYLHTGRLRL